MSKNVELTGWMVVPGGDHCAMRCIAGADIHDIANRVAFIEKTPRVRVLPLDPKHPDKDGAMNWEYGCKGGMDYGRDIESRAWCDEKLASMGYTFAETFGLDDIRHPYSDLNLSDAINVARGIAGLNNEKVQSLQVARQVISNSEKNCGHVWITGSVCLDLLDAAIDGRNLQEESRLIERDSMAESSRAAQ